MMTFCEDNFIHEEYGKKPYLFWTFAVFTALIIVLIAIASHFADDLKSSQFQDSPFLRVTNREFSLFLWQHPHLMRVHAKNKIGYLTGFQYLHKVNMEPQFTEEFVTAPPALLFLYHTWKRLVSSYVPKKTIQAEEFKEFLHALEEWHPKNWPFAPKRYAEFVNNLENIEDLPSDIKQAFFGWKNYFKEGDAINAFCPQVKDVKEFLRLYPNYARNYWQNIYPDYLKSLQEAHDDSIVPSDEIPPFFKVALYNAS